MNKFAEILISQKIGFDKETLTYQIPDNLSLEIGNLVEISLRNKNTIGLILNIHNNQPQFQTKYIQDKVNDIFHLTKTQVNLLKFISQNYFSPLYKTLKLFYPSIVFNRKKKYQFKKPQESTIISPSNLILTTEQNNALKIIKNTNSSTILLHGVTGSGKTEIYKRLALEQIKENKQVLILIPEISLTPQTVKNFEKQFGKNIAVIHSKLTPKSKLNHLINIAQNNCQIIIGSRSAIFSPFQNLGLIIMDEEHEDSYKQEQSPRYHTKDIAIFLSQNSPLKPKVILGSATPSIESYFEAQKQNYLLVEMPHRLPQANQQNSLPKIHLIDLREEIRKKNYSIFSELLKEKINETLNKKEQIILFLNRRGNSSAVICRDCGYTKKCTHCSVALTYHSKSNKNSTTQERLICHHCGRIFAIPKTCENCSSHLIKYIGLGTQKIEQELNTLFPQAKILRADKDTTKNKNDFEDIYNNFKKSNADILIGTQMIGKGLHLPNVTLVGIILADTTLSIPDLRASEKTFQLLTQVAGRSGRTKPGEVIIQTYAPQHFTIQNVLNHNFINYYQQELHHRKENFYPPFSKLIKLTIEDKDQKIAYNKSQNLFQKLQEFKNQNMDLIYDINVFPALINKLKNKYRWQILLNGNNPSQFLHNFFLINNIKDDIKIDVNPIHTT